MNPDLSPALYGLLAAKLDSLEKLELVLAVRAGSGPVALAELALELQVGHDVLRRVANEVVATGLLQVAPGDAFVLRERAASAELEEAARIYHQDPKKLMRVFTRLALDRIKGMAARSFADAFRIRRKGG